MTIREAFAANLAKLVESRGSVSFVARQLGMTHQHLSLYLNAKHTPNQVTIRKFCRYFRVTEEYLFRQDEPGMALPGGWQEVVDRVTASPPAIAPGYYVTYFWGARLPTHVVGALTVIRKDGDILTFRRITASVERRPNSRWSYVRGDHQGVISERLNWIYFQGSNRLPPHEPTLLTLQWAVTPRPLLAGHGMIISPFGPEMIKVAMRSIGQEKLSLRSALAFSRVYAVEEIDSDVSRVLFDRK